MKNALVVSADSWRKVRAHLLSDGAEHLCFLLTRHAPSETGDLFLERELVIVEDSDLQEGGRRGLTLKTSALIRVMNRANEAGCVMFEAHSHPFSKDRVDFSGLDFEGQLEMVSHLRDITPGRPYGALVLGQRAVLGQVWFPQGGQPRQLDVVRVVGPVIEEQEAKGRARRESSPELNQATDPYHRQVLALGPEGQEKIRRCEVAIVGLGGIGSIVAEQLAHLGVCRFVLVDGDTVESTNLHRLVGATRGDIGIPKVDVAARRIREINPQAHVTVLKDFLRSMNTLRRLMHLGVIFGCVDSDSGRLILTELTNAYLIPYIDAGVGVEVQNGKIVEAGGRVVVWVPGRPCLLCSKNINALVAAEELESPEQRQFRQEHGYVTGATVPEPAVISLNGIVASMAATEFLALVTGFRESYHYRVYDMLEQRVIPRVVRPQPNCFACTLLGTGDAADMDRYARGWAVPQPFTNP